jgi:hypothetical protein
MLAALVLLSSIADRFWPLWMTALHAFGVVGHIAKTMAPDILPNVYHAAHAFSAYPVTVILIVATWRHRNRLAMDGHDRSWSISSPATTARVPVTGPTG